MVTDNLEQLNPWITIKKRIAEYLNLSKEALYHLLAPETILVVKKQFPLRNLISFGLFVINLGCSSTPSPNVDFQTGNDERRMFNKAKNNSTKPPSAIDKPECKSSCSATQVCMNSFTNAGAQCLPIPDEAPLTDLVLPFDASTEVICTHSSGSGSHSGANAYYALDLATDYNRPAATIRAAADGVAYVFLGEDGKLCPAPSGTSSNAQPSTCGQSWGNHIRILHSNGYLSFYVHLDHPLITNGSIVHKGDPIGIEGWTGAAGHRHLHWSIQKLPGSNQTDWINRISWAGASVPFHFKAKQNDVIQDFDVANIQCAHAGIGQAPPDQQPRFKGIQ